MALNQTGPSASAKQVAYLQALLQKAGYGGFREARRPLGLTQRQGNGKFTSKEASALIDQLINGEAPDEAAATAAADTARRSGDVERDERRDTARSAVLRGFPADLLAEELERRGWTVAPP
jgi:hypothetical protein